MSDARNKFVRYIRRMGAGSMLISIIVHVIVIIGATVWVVSSVTPPRKALFKGGDGGTSEVRRPVKMSNTQPKLDTLTKRLSVDSPNSTVSLPDLPTNPDSGLSSPALGTNAGAPGAAGGLKGPLMPIFGFKEPVKSGSLIGTLFLIPSDQYKTNDAEIEAAKSFFKKLSSGGWSESTLGSLKKSPSLLYNTQIVIPSIVAKEAPKAFGVPPQESLVRFLIRYRAKVTAPRGGRWRFVGYGDDIMVVRINNQVVLEASAPWSKLDKPGLTGWKPLKIYAYDKSDTGKYFVGSWFQPGTSAVDMEVYMSEEPRAGDTSAVLLIEEEGAKYEKTSAGLPVLPIWTLAPNPTNPSGKLKIPVATEAPVWRATASVR
ncbi:MAG: hypothetical protein WC661_13845 [Opitutaceae bacterium]|jgi:hypothetical protein